MRDRTWVHTKVKKKRSGTRPLTCYWEQKRVPSPRWGRYKSLTQRRWMSVWIDTRLCVYTRQESKGPDGDGVIEQNSQG